MRIRRVEEDRKAFMDLLLLADEQEEMVADYLDRGEMFVLEDGEVLGECVVTDEEDGVLEIRNIAVYPEHQGKGFGEMLVGFLAERYRDRFSSLQAGTGDSPLTVPFYEACGFVRHHVEKNYFTEHYDHPIVEQDKVLKDRIVLRRDL